MVLCGLLMAHGGVLLDGEQLVAQHESIAWAKNQFFEKCAKWKIAVGAHASYQSSPLGIITQFVGKSEVKFRRLLAERFDLQHEVARRIDNGRSE